VVLGLRIRQAVEVRVDISFRKLLGVLRFNSVNELMEKLLLISYFGVFQYLLDQFFSVLFVWLVLVNILRLED